MTRDVPGVHKAKVEGYKFLFKYIQEVSNDIGEEKALDILSDIQTQADIKWFEDNAPHLDLTGPPLEAAYRMMFEDLLEVNLADIDIVEQSENRIVHHYDLPCSILDACVELGLDTRKYCKALHQKAANLQMQLVDPRLRFDRDYTKIRPYVDTCVEMFWVEE